MAFFGLFGNKGGASALKKHIDRVGNKRAQDVDRWASIQVLAKAGTAEAVAGLLPRFTFYVDPSITDQEEKDAAFEAIVSTGDVAIDPVVAFLRKAESIAWPLKMLDALCSQEVVVGHLLSILEGMDTEYERDPQRKIDTIAALGERPDLRSCAVLQRFIEDTNETARFDAVGSIFAQANAADATAALVSCHGREESLRVRNRILEGLRERKLPVEEGQRAELQAALPATYRLDDQGVLQRSK